MKDADPRVQKTADWCRHWGDVHGVDDMEAVAQLIERLQARVEELTKPVEDAEEGEFTSCAEMLDDWFGSCNIQGTAQMETVELEELLEEMRLIEKRKNQICVHGKGLTDYCEPCGRIHGG